MTGILLAVVIALLIGVTILQIIQFRKTVTIDLSPLESALQSVESCYERIERSVKEEISKNREEGTTGARQSREELSSTLKAVGDTLNKTLTNVAQANDHKIDAMRETVELRLQLIQDDGTKKLDKVREDSLSNAKNLREEIGTTLTSFNQSLVNNIGEMGKLQKSQLDIFSERLTTLTTSSDQKLDTMRETIERRLGVIHQDSGVRLDEMRRESNVAAQKGREELTASLNKFSESEVSTLKDMGDAQRNQMEVVIDRLAKLTDATEKKLESQKATIDQRLREIQTDSAASAKQIRDEVGGTLKAFNDSVLKTMTSLSDGQQKEMGAFTEQLAKLTETNQHKLDGLRTAVELKLTSIQQDNAKQLDQMRATVDEKLQGTLEKRLGESFKQVSERLEQVYKGLGEMQVLATGVGDLKKVLTNVKTRGTWGEVQLGAMLEQILTKDQFAHNVATKEGGERVEFAIKLPGRGQDADEMVWLPIDAKFPIEDYQRLIDAQEKADVEGAEIAIKQLEARIKASATELCAKYLNPPKTTDFGILYLPTEGLFAEVIRRTGLVEFVQNKCRVVIAGPTTLWSILNSLQMGFKTLAIQQRSSEVWNLLSAVKTEWSKYGEVLSKVQKKLQEAANTVDDAAKRTRVIGRKLKDVQELPTADAAALLLIETAEDAEAGDGDGAESGKPEPAAV